MAEIAQSRGFCYIGPSWANQRITENWRYSTFDASRANRRGAAAMPRAPATNHLRQATGREPDLGLRREILGPRI
jgi:hypothetical protein